MAFCMNCGTRLGETDRFCAACGTSLQPPAPTPGPTPQETVPVPDSRPLRAVDLPPAAAGWSDAAGSPAVTAFAREKNRKALILFGIIAALIVLGTLLLYLFFRPSNLMDVPTAIGVAVLFLLIALYKFLKGAARRNAHWEGVLEDKRIRTKTDSGEHGPRHTHHFHELFFQTSTGKRYKIDVTQSAWEVFQPGDPVRKHRGFTVPERLSKLSGRTMCLSCSQLNDAGLANCGNCKAPLF